MYSITKVPRSCVAINCAAGDGADASLDTAAAGGGARSLALVMHTQLSGRCLLFLAFRYITGLECPKCLSPCFLARRYIFTYETLHSLSHGRYLHVTLLEAPGCHQYSWTHTRGARVPE
jgi:hypothetical protein